MPQAATIGKAPVPKGRAKKQEKMWSRRVEEARVNRERVEDQRMGRLEATPLLSESVSKGLQASIKGASAAASSISQQLSKMGAAVKVKQPGGKPIKLAPKGGIELSPQTIRELEEKGYKPAKLGNSRYFEVPQYIYDTMLSKIGNKQKRRRARKDAYRSRRQQVVAARG